MADAAVFSSPVLRQNLIHPASARYGREADAGQDNRHLVSAVHVHVPADLRWVSESEEATRGPVTSFRGHKTTEEEGLRRSADVAVVQATDFGKLHDLPCHGELDRPEVGRVLVQREMRTRLMVVGEVSGQDAAEVLLAEDEHVIQALAPDGANEPLREGVLPR